MWWRLGTSLFNLAGVTGLAAVAAHWTWHEWEPPLALAAEPPVRSSEPIVPRQLAALFGPSGEAPAIRGSSDGASVSYVLTGIVLSGSTPGQAVLRPVQPGEPLAAFQGDEIPGGYRISAVEPDAVTLSRHGRTMRLPLPQPGPEPAGTRSERADAEPGSPPDKSR